MYCTLGDIVFEALNGFSSYNEADEGVIAQYALIQGKPFPQAMAPNLREITVGMKLHQRFIKIEQARLQLRAYKDNGTTVTLTWGNGKVEGRFLIQQISTGIEEGDALGNVYCVTIGLTLLEVPSDNLLASKQADSQKAAFGVGSFTTPIVKPPVVPLTALQQFQQTLAKAMRYAALIDALAYGGLFPTYLGSNLGQVMGNASANYTLMGTLFAHSGADWDIPDITTPLGNVTGDLATLSGIDPVMDPTGFAAQNDIFQGDNRVLCF